MKKIALLFALTLFASCAPQLSIPKNARLRSLFLSPDGEKFALSYSDNGYDYVNFDGKILGPYDHVWFPRYLPEQSTHFVPVFVYQRVAGRFLYINGKNFGPYVSLPLYGPEVSDNALHFAFKYRADGKDFYHFDGTNFGPYLKAGGWEFSPDGRQYAFWFVKDGSFYAMINGKERLLGERYQAPFFDNRGRLSFVSEKNSRLSLSINGRRIGTYDFLMPPTFAENNYALIAENSRSRFVLTPERKYGPFQNIVGDPAVDSDTVAFLELRGKKALYVHINDKSFGPFEQAYPPRLYGKRFCFRYVTNKQNFIRVDDKVFGPFKYSADVAFGTNGQIVITTLSNQTVVIQRHGENKL